jgi:hypothetical protein
MERDFFFVPKVDSCKISIPLNEVEILDTTLQEQHYTPTINVVSAEVVSEKTTVGRPFIFYDEETHEQVKVWIENQMFYLDNGAKATQKYITLLINSKHLHENYFRGITKDTFKDIYEYMMSYKIFYCEYDKFQKARWSDLDICFDFPSTRIEFDTLKKNVLASVRKPSLWTNRTSKSNVGLWAPSEYEPRKTAKKKPTKPYVKFYHKEVDFVSVKSHIGFGQKYLKEEQYKDVGRYEATISDATHKKRLGVDAYKSIWDLITKGDLRTICGQLFREYTDKPKRIVKEGNTPNDKILIDMMNELIERGMTTTELFAIFDREDVSKRTNSNLVSKYHALMNHEQINKEKMEGNSLTKVVMEYLGVKEQMTSTRKNKNKDKK